ncbi:M23 family peptidase [Anaerobacillus alkaliphilus]|uniref:M23 family peptidase n=1 Tax=Anaerobacillus alkaliphilus TaxID=1548597 RepID=A0A4Q0VPY8_9BACI|nr:M23 family metallopeptidase [Anaerobacillus alkaliphilus]RXI98161.1 M23 family peptidase [Anaerobacillus alkaliphilus]
MKWLLILLSSFLIMSACGARQHLEQQETKATKENYYGYQLEKKDELKRISLATIGEERVINVPDFVKSLNGEYQYDPIHRTLKIEIGEDIYKFIYGVPVIEKNGVYLPINNIELFVVEENIYLPLNFLRIVLGLDIRYGSEGDVFYEWDESALVTNSSYFNLIEEEEWTVNSMIDYLGFLTKPIEGAKVSTIPNHLPGAKRAYRNGYHEGIDWYAYASGQHISTTTPVYAMAEGVIVRADHDYQEYVSQENRNQDLHLTVKLGETPEYIFDRLRGRQVWVQYDKGVMNRFAHLDSIPEDIKVGDVVNSSTVIGYVGNSGTSGAVKKDGTQLHLHQDILIYGELFWKPFSLEEVKIILQSVFGE